MRTKNSVCYKCPRHTESCHGGCPDYLKEDAENNARNQAQMEKSRSSGVLSDRYYQTETRYIRSTGRRIKMAGWR